jgi:hypothetical protein
MPKVASDANVEEAGSDAGKKKSWEDKHRCRGIDVEVEELDGSPDQTSEEDLARRIDVL